MEPTESTLEMEGCGKMKTNEDTDGSIGLFNLFTDEDSGLESDSDAHDNSVDLRIAEVSISVEPRFQEQLTTGYS